MQQGHIQLVSLPSAQSTHRAILEFWAFVWRQVSLHLLPLQISPKVQTSGFFQRHGRKIWHPAPNISQNLPHKPLETWTLVLMLFSMCWNQWNCTTVRQKWGEEMAPWEALLDSNGENEAVNHHTAWWWDSAARLINTLIQCGMDAQPDVFLSAEAAEGFQGLQWVCWRQRNY